MFPRIISLLVVWSVGLVPMLATAAHVVDISFYRNLEGLEQAMLVGTDIEGTAQYMEVRNWSLIPINEFEQRLDPNKVYWAKITLVSQLDEITDWVLHTGYNNLTDVYIETHGRVYHKLSGELLPTDQKDIKEVRKDCAFKLRLVPKQPAIIYIRIQSLMGHAPKFEVSLETAESWELYDRLHYVVQSVFFGALIIMLLYNVAVYISTRQAAYGHYTLFILSSLIYFLWFHGFVHLFFLPNTPKLNTYFWLFSILTPIFYLQFIRLLLDLPHHGSLDRIAKIVIWGNASILAVAFLIFAITFDSALTVRVVNTVLAADALLFSFLLYKLSSLESRLIAYFLGGVAFFLVCSFLGVFGYSYLEWNDAVYAVQVGIIGQILLHSLGLGYKMRAAEQDRQSVQLQLIGQLEQNHRLQQDANRELEGKVLARTAEIAMQKHQIEDQNEELRALNEEKNNLIRIVAHDLKSPLNRVIGLISVIRLEEERFTGEQLGYMDLITETSNRLREMVMRILDADAIEEQNPKFSLDTFNMTDWVAKRVKDFEERARQKDIKLAFEGDVKNILVHTDANYFEQIFENLLSNALKFSPRWTQVRVSVQEKDGKALIYIADNGPGLNEDDHKKLFKKYQKLSAKPTAGEESTGLGLSIVKRYVDLLGGNIWCESTFGKGATFYISMPIHQQEHAYQQ